jgi:hypothetical protein
MQFLTVYGEAAVITDKAVVKEMYKAVMMLGLLEKMT